MRRVPVHVKRSARDLVMRLDRSLLDADDQRHGLITKRDADAVWYLLDLVDADISGDLAALERERFPLIAGRARRRVNPS